MILFLKNRQDFKIADQSRLICLLLRAPEQICCYRCEDADDHDNNQQLDQREAFSSVHRRTSSGFVDFTEIKKGRRLPAAAPQNRIYGMSQNTTPGPAVLPSGALASPT